MTWTCGRKTTSRPCRVETNDTLTIFDQSFEEPAWKTSLPSLRSRNIWSVPTALCASRMEDMEACIRKTHRHSGGHAAPDRFRDFAVLHGITRWLPIAYTLCTKFVSERNRVGVSTGKMHVRSLTHFLPQKATCKDYSCIENYCRSCPIWLPLLRKTWGGWTPRTTSVSSKGPSYFNVDYESTCNRTSLAGVHFFLSIQPCRWTLQDYFDHGQCPQSEQAR